MPVAAREVDRADHAEVQAIALSEMVDLAAGDRSALTRGAARIVLRMAAWELARSLCGLDRDLARSSLREAALQRLRYYGVGARIEGPGLHLSELALATAPVPERGPLLVVANHPGLFDALALFAAAGRDDLSIIAADRPLLCALPHLRKRLLIIEAGAAGGFAALRSAIGHFKNGGALIHFPAGHIEPDPRCAPKEQALLSDWKLGVDTLVRAAARVRPDLHVVPMAISGVLSDRARALARIVAGRDGLTDAIVPLLQLTFPLFHDTDVRVHVGPVFASDDLLGPDADGRAIRPSDVLRPALTALVEGARTNFAPAPSPSDAFASTL